MPLKILLCYWIFSYIFLIFIMSLLSLNMFLSINWKFKCPLNKSFHLEPWKMRTQETVTFSSPCKWVIAKVPDIYCIPSSFSEGIVTWLTFLESMNECKSIRNHCCFKTKYFLEMRTESISWVKKKNYSLLFSCSWKFSQKG